MKKYTLKRIITSLFTLLAILLVLFILMQLMPGSPFNDEKLTPEMRASLYAKYGLDQPIYVQFFRYVTNMLRGDFGVSYNISKNTPISQLIQSRLPISIRVGGMAVTLGAIVGLVLGIIAALKRVFTLVRPSRSRSTSARDSRGSIPTSTGLLFTVQRSTSIIRRPLPSGPPPAGSGRTAP